MMNRFFLLALIFLCSCGSINTIESTPESNNNNNEFPYFNKDLKFRYQISNDDKNLHLRMTSQDYTILSKILTTGLRICFDATGKKKDNVYLECPLRQKQEFSDRIMARVRYSQRQNYSLNNLLSQVPNIAIFVSNGVVDRFPVLPADSDIKVSVRLRNGIDLIYDLIIPFNRISKNGISSLSNLSIGVVTTSPNVPAINTTITDVSGESALGDATNRNKTFYLSDGTTNARIPQVDRYSRSRPGVPTPSRINDFWFKVHLNAVK
jgi:hypothetical protein